MESIIFPRALSAAFDCIAFDCIFLPFYYCVCQPFGTILQPSNFWPIGKDVNLNYLSPERVGAVLISLPVDSLSKEKHAGPEVRELRNCEILNPLLYLVSFLHIEGNKLRRKT